MNARLHSVLKYVYAAFLVGSGIKHLYNIYVADPTIMATGYPEPEATAFVLAVLENKFLLPFICTAKLIAGIVILLPGREQLGVVTAFPTPWACSWGIFGAEPHRHHVRHIQPQRGIGPRQLGALQGSIERLTVAPKHKSPAVIQPQQGIRDADRRPSKGQPINCMLCQRPTTPTTRRSRWSNRRR